MTPTDQLHRKRLMKSPYYGHATRAFKYFMSNNRHPSRISGFTQGPLQFTVVSDLCFTKVHDTTLYYRTTQAGALSKQGMTTTPVMPHTLRLTNHSQSSGTRLFVFSSNLGRAAAAANGPDLAHAFCHVLF